MRTAGRTQHGTANFCDAAECVSEECGLTERPSARYASPVATSVDSGQPSRHAWREINRNILPFPCAHKPAITEGRIVPCANDLPGVRSWPASFENCGVSLRLACGISSGQPWVLVEGIPPMTFVDLYVADPDARPFDWNTLPHGVTDNLPEPLSWASSAVNKREKAGKSD
jgi:hypothetical protein